MATVTQISANTANAQHSTGPRTPEGKAASSRNALKFGIFSQATLLPGEDPDAYAELLDDFLVELQPAGPLETQLVHDIVNGIWLDHRYTRIETEIINLRLAALPPEEQRYALGAIFIQDAEGSRILEKIDRRRNASHRQVDAARKELRRLQSARTPDPTLLLEMEPAPVAEPAPKNSVRSDKPATTANPPASIAASTPRHTAKNAQDDRAAVQKDRIAGAINPQVR